MSKAKELFARRKTRNRYQLRLKSGGRPRLSVYRSGRNVYAQVIDDAKGLTVASASSNEKDAKSALQKGSDLAAAALVGKRSRRASRTSYSIAAVTFTTGASKRSPRRPARAA